jgi:preprotein translocase subunit SecD
MNRSWFMRVLLVLAVFLTAAYMLYPSVEYYGRASQEQRDDRDVFCKSLPAWSHCKIFNLGLDLQGGVHLVMGVRVEKAIEQRLDRVADSLREGLKKDNIAFTKLERPRDAQELVLELAPEASTDAARSLIAKDFSVLTPTTREGQTMHLELVSQEADAVRTNAVDQAINVIRNRADKLGVTEPQIAKRGTDSILVQLPGVKDPERAIDVIGRTAQLEFKIVDTESTAAFDTIADLPAGVVKREESERSGAREVYFELPASEKEAMIALLTPKIPATREIAFGRIDARGSSKTSAKTDTLRTYVLDTHAVITGDYLTIASVQQDQEVRSRHHVGIEFDSEGAKLFENLTAANVNRRMAIVLDGNVNSAPNISEKIGGGHARITLGSGDPQHELEEAKNLSLVLKSGALPAPVEVREKRQVGRTLGDQAVHDGSFAIIVGTGFLILFMLFYYRLSGVIADMALILNIFLLLAVLALFEATLTLPGMAGIVLTVGMAVDANVLIFERIRDELAAGKPVRAAIDSGYAKAFSSIFDSNVTTLIAGVVLMQYGTGPVRGFAVSLIVGIICSLFTAVVFTRLIFDFFVNRGRIRSLSI